MTIDKTFDPGSIEQRWYAHWEQGGLFHPARPDAEPFTIVIPPPNVTGSLHIGHALDNTLQDILVRHARLRGRDALWVVGTDHAGIATQMVVERNLDREGVKRADLGRDAFVERIWQWKAESGGTITGQLRRLGASCDWANERFTMDEGFSQAVLKVFVDLHAKGLIYRDKRLVNWDPGLKTAISDLEVETREVQGHFWHFQYPLEDGSGLISVATTRPETMLADMAVAVNPADDRYKALIGSNVILPLTGRAIPIIADDHADPELGSGAVKITPGHDFNDFEVGRRAGIEPGEMLNMLDADGRVIDCGGVPAELIGLDRFEARGRIVEAMDLAGFLEQVEDRPIQIPYGDRSGVVIEPWLTDQWYVDAGKLAGPAIDAVRSGAIRVVPKSWEKTYYNWLENIQPWCVSRQLWWGHQIPAWYGPSKDPESEASTADARRPDLAVFVAEDEAAARVKAAAYYGVPVAEIEIAASREDGLRVAAGAYEQRGTPVPLWRDSDVLDTWFSSALWPFGTLGWPDDMAKVQRHYPNDVLISGFDILFFWDARMIMQGLQFMEEVPFRTLYLHGLVRDANGQKMSKSKGNAVDPLGLIDRYGADALRFTLAAMESQGRDIKLDEKRVKGYRNFATKLWNAARFAQANGIGASASIEPPPAALPVNRWIIAETITTVRALDLALADMRFDEAANRIYQFVWSRFCDWYLELIKTELQGEGEGTGADECRVVAGWVLDQILVMLHPFMPFVTEELWHAMGERPYDLIVAKWPMADARAIDPDAAAEIDWLIRLVSEVRAARSELNVPPGAKLAAYLRDAGPETRARLSRQASALARLARIEPVSDQPAPAVPAAQVIVDEATFVLPLEGVIDIAAERGRLSKAVALAVKERVATEKKLANPAFVERAKPEVVVENRERLVAFDAEIKRLAMAIERLS